MDHRGNPLGLSRCWRTPGRRIRSGTCLIVDAAERRLPKASSPPSAERAVGRRREGEDTKANYREAQKQRARGRCAFFRRRLSHEIFHIVRVRWGPEGKRQRSGRERRAIANYRFPFKWADGGKMTRKSSPSWVAGTVRTNILLYLNIQSLFSLRETAGRINDYMYLFISDLYSCSSQMWRSVNGDIQLQHQSDFGRTDPKTFIMNYDLTAQLHHFVKLKKSYALLHIHEGPVPGKCSSMTCAMLPSTGLQQNCPLFFTRLSNNTR